MIIGSMKEVFLTRARDIFIFDYKIAGLDPDTLNAYRNVLRSFIRFTGDIRVRQLTPDHLEMYIANLYDGHDDGDDQYEIISSQYDVIQTWIHWMYLQKYITERPGSFAENTHLTGLFPPRSAKSLAV